jgi:tetratricopeptide (TPR) repeat protein
MYHHLRGSLLEQASQPDEARRAYERALELDPSQAETTVNLALLLGRLGKPDEGIRMLDRLIARHPTAEGALRNRATLKLAQNDARGFAADLEAAHKVLPVAAVARALSQHYAGSGAKELAESWRQEWLRLDPARR